MFQYCSFLIRCLKQSSNSIFRLIAFGLYLIFYFYTLIGHLLKKLRHHRVGRPMETKVAGWRPLLAELCLLFDFFFFLIFTEKVDRKQLNFGELVSSIFGTV